MRRRHKPSKDEVYHPQIVVGGSSIETLMFLPRMRTLVKSHFKALEICQGGGANRRTNQSSTVWSTHFICYKCSLITSLQITVTLQNYSFTYA